MHKSLVIIIAALLFSVASLDRPVRAGSVDETIGNIDKAIQRAARGEGGPGGGGGATDSCLASNPRPNDSAFSKGWAKGCSSARKTPKQSGRPQPVKVGGSRDGGTNNQSSTTLPTGHSGGGRR